VFQPARCTGGQTKARRANSVRVELKAPPFSRWPGRAARSPTRTSLFATGYARVQNACPQTPHFKRLPSNGTFQNACAQRPPRFITPACAKDLLSNATLQNASPLKWLLSKSPCGTPRFATPQVQNGPGSQRPRFATAQVQNGPPSERHVQNAKLQNVCIQNVCIQNVCIQKRALKTCLQNACCHRPAARTAAGSRLALKTACAQIGSRASAFRPLSFPPFGTWYSAALCSSVFCGRSGHS
jgi:hypothetical protein